MKRYLALLLLLTHSYLFGLATFNFGTISSTAGNNGPPQVAVAGNGNATAVWTNNGGGSAIVAATFTAPITPTGVGTWAAPLTLGSGSAPKIATDATGNALVVWVSTNNQIVASRFNVTTGLWSGLFTVSTTGGTNSSPQISMNSSGVALVIWLQTPYAVLSSTFNPTTLTFSTLPTLFLPSTSSLSGTNPASFALDNINSGIALWQITPSLVIQAARLFVP